MEQGDLGVALSILRVVRGWSQEELERSSGVRDSAISDYERGRVVPDLSTLRRLLDSMGYCLAELDDAQTLVLTLRADSALRAAASLAEETSPEGEPASTAEPPVRQALRFEME